MDDKEKSPTILEIDQIVEGGQVENQSEEVTKEPLPGSFYNGEFDRRQKSKFSIFLKDKEERISKWWKGFQIKAFWIVFLILLGIFVGSYVCLKVYDYKTDESIKLGGFIFKDKIYDIRERIK